MCAAGEDSKWAVVENEKKKKEEEVRGQGKISVQKISNKRKNHMLSDFKLPLEMM
jgi:hypothetical protein